MQMSVITNIQNQLTTALGTDKTMQSVALGVAIAFTMPVPTQRQELADSYYTSNYFANIDTMLSVINEVFLIEIQTVHDVARTLWNMRYRSVYLSDTDIADLATKANPIREYLGGFQLDDVQIQQVLATGQMLSNMFCSHNLLKTDDTTRG